MAKILICDDDQFIVEIVSKRLIKYGHDVVQALSAEQALASSKDQTIELFILDLHMPNHSGFDLVTKLRMHPAYAKTPIMMLTTESSPEVINQGKGLGVSDWGVKPLNNAKLLEMINLLLKEAGGG